MHPPPTDRLLALLRDEAALLGTAVEHAAGVHAALRRGDVPTVAAALPHHERLADALRGLAAERGGAAAAVATAAGLPADGVTLAELADRLPAAAGQLLAARDRLRELSAELISYQTGNANLIRHLRSYFRGVLSGPTEAAAPVRYGPSGTRVDPPSGIRVLARG
jgi:hypothetical protein